MDWIKVEEQLPDVKPIPGLELKDGFPKYYESNLVLVAFERNGKIFYEVAKYTKGKDTTADKKFWQSWYVPQAEDVVLNVVAWMPFPTFNLS